MSRSMWVRDTLIAAGYSVEDADRAMAEVKAEHLKGLADKAETFRGDWGVVAAWIRSEAEDPAWLRAMATPAAAPVPVKTAEALRGRALLDAKTVADAEATHWRRLGITPETRRCTCGNAAYEQMYDRRVPCKPDCERKGGAS